MEEASWRRNQGGKVIGVEPWTRNLGQAAPGDTQETPRRQGTQETPAASESNSGRIAIHFG